MILHGKVPYFFTPDQQSRGRQKVYMTPSEAEEAPRRGHDANRGLETEPPRSVR